MTDTNPIPEAADAHSTRGAYVTGAEFTRDTQYIEDRIVRDPVATLALPAPPATGIGALGFGLSEGAEAWPVEAGRYRLVAAAACPWANRTVIVRRLLGLEGAISLGTPAPCTTYARGRSISTRAGAIPCSAPSGCRRTTSSVSQATRAASPCRRSSISRAGES